MRQIDGVEADLVPIERWMRTYARRQPGCRALLESHFGFGPINSVTVVAEFGDMRRFANRETAVRFTGLDVSVYSSDSKRAPGKLSRQGSPTLRWALYEAAKCHARTGAPHHDLYARTKERLGGKRATMTVARRLVRDIRHTLVALGDDAIAPVDDLPIDLSVAA